MNSCDQIPLFSSSIQCDPIESEDWRNVYLLCSSSPTGSNTFALLVNKTCKQVFPLFVLAHLNLTSCFKPLHSLNKLSVCHLSFLCTCPFINIPYILQVGISLVK